jgi:hypothetical protein
MKRSMTIVFFACVAWCIASAAGADAITIYDTTSGSVSIGTMDVTRTAYAVTGGTLDKVVFKMASWAPAYAGAKINVLCGTWTIFGGGAYLGGDETSWKGGTTMEFNPQDHFYYDPTPPQTFMQFTSMFNETNSFHWSRTASSADPVLGYMYSAFYGGWYEIDGAYNVGIGDTFATFYVTRGADIMFNANGDPDGFATTLGKPKHCKFYAPGVPEPGTLALLAAGLACLLAYAWRNRL